MPSEIQVVPVGDFVKATVQGAFDLEASKQALAEIATAVPNPPTHILIDIREAPGSMTLAQVSELASDFSKQVIGAGRKTAILTAEDRFSNAHFFAVSARGMGRTVQAFTSYDEAADWLALPS